MMYDETFIYAQTYTFSLEGQVNRLLMNVTCLFYLDYIFDILSWDFCFLLELSMSSQTKIINTYKSSDESKPNREKKILHWINHLLPLIISINTLILSEYFQILIYYFTSKLYFSFLNY